jgi:hypothetical protein
MKKIHVIENPFDWLHIVNVSIAFWKMDNKNSPHPEF